MNAETKKNDDAQAEAQIARADAAELSDAIQKSLSPEAVAMIAGLLQTADHAGNDAPETGVARDEVAWFRDFLIDNLGGADAFNRLQDEIGL